MELTWTTQKRKVSDLIPTDANPRKLTTEGRERLKAKIEKLGVFEIPAVDENNKLLNFNQRLKILLMLGKGNEFIDVRVPSRALTQEERKEIVLSSNIHEGEWDVDILESDYAELDLEDIGLDIDALLEGYQSDDIEVDQDLEEKDNNFGIDDIDVIRTDIKEGDLIVIGDKHRILCGDASDSKNWKHLMQDEKVDMVITDPPYNVNYTGSTDKKLKIKNDALSDDDFSNLIHASFSSMHAYTKEGGVWYVFHSDTYGDVFRRHFKECGLHLSQCLVWLKNHFVLGRQDYHWIHEPCLYGWKKGRHKWFNDRKQTTVLQFDRPLRNEEHPTMKPTALLSYLLGNSSKPGQLICDAFLGSGSTLISSHLLDRKCYGMELDPKYCQVIIDRMRNIFPEISVDISSI